MPRLRFVLWPLDADGRDDEGPRRGDRSRRCRPPASTCAGRWSCCASRPWPRRWPSRPATSSPGTAISGSASTWPGARTTTKATRAGEVDEVYLHMRDTLVLGATRIGHGNNILTDEGLVLHLRAGIALVGNPLLEYVDDYSRHHFAELLRTGIPVALSTDDSGMWDSNMTDEYMTAVTEFNPTWDELIQCGRNSFKWSFAEPALKEKLLADYDRDLKLFESRFSGNGSDAINEAKSVSYGFAKRRWGIGD